MLRKSGFSEPLLGLDPSDGLKAAFAAKTSYPTCSTVSCQEIPSMKRSKKEKQPQPIQVWTLAQARAARPYILTLVRSLRDNSLEVISRRRELGRLNDLPGRPDRRTLIAIQEAQSEVNRAEDRVHED